MCPSASITLIGTLAVEPTCRCSLAAAITTLSSDWWTP